MSNLGVTMDEQLIRTYRWKSDKYELFEAIVTNGELTDLRFCGGRVRR